MIVSVFQGFRYSGTQYTHECFCDNDYGKYGGASNCNANCPGNGAQKCGGTWAVSVYEVGK